MRFVPIDEVDKEEPGEFRFVPLTEEPSPEFASALKTAREGVDTSELPMPKVNFTEAPKAETRFVPTEEERQLSMSEPTSNPFKGLVARGASLIGEGVEGFTRATEALGKKMEGSLTEEERAGMQALKENAPVPTVEFDPNTYKKMQGWANSLKDFGKEINYQPSQKLGDIADNPATIVPFIAERIIASSPDMAAAVLAFPAYVTARTNEILNQRLINDEKTLADATVSDVAVATGAAVLEGTLERFATKGLGRPTAATTGAGRIGKETAIQSGTEGIEEGIGYLGGAAGTKKGVDYRELGEQMLEGAIVGGGLGATVQGTKEGYEVYKERAADNEYKDAMATILQDKGFSFAPPEVQQEVTTSLLDTVKGDLQERVDNIKERLAAFRAPATTEGEPEADAKQKFYEQAQARYQDMGMTRAQARQLANQDFEEAGYGDRLDAGTVQPSVSVPSEQRGADAGTPAPIGRGVGRDSETAVLPSGGAEAKPSALKPETKKWFGKSKAVDKQGKPLVLYRGLVGGEVDPFTGRPGYAVFTSDNPYIASSYSGDPAYEFGVSEGVVYPMYAKVDDVVEFPGGDAFDKFEFDKKAKTLKPGQALVARDVMDTGPRMTTEMAKGYEKKSGDVWAFANGTEFKSAIEGAPTPAAVEETVTPIAPVKQGKPRGRKKLDLTEEEAAAKKAARAEQTKEWKATNKQLLDAQNVLNLEAPIREDFTNEDAYLDASMRYRTDRQAALDLLNGMATGARRNTALGKRAQEGLTNPNITPQELAAVKEREALRKGTARSELLEATNGVENDKYADFSNGGQALSWIAKNGNEFESTLAKRILPFVRNMRVVIVRSSADLPTNYLRSQFEGAAGMYSNGVIYLDANGGMNNTVFLHEALHGATIDRINKYLDDVAEGREPEAKLAEAVEEMNAVMKSAGRLYDALNKLGMTDERTDALARANAFTDIKEFVAYGMSQPAMQEFLLQAPGMYLGPKTSFFDGVFNRFVQSIRKMFNMGEKHNSAMQDLIIVTDKLLATEIGEPKVTKQQAALAKKQTQKFDADAEKIRLSNTSTDMVSAIGESIDNHSFEPIKELLDARFEDLGNGFIKKTLYTMQTADILRWKGNEIPALVEVDALTQEMSAMRMRMMAASAKKADALAAFIRKNGSVALSNTMHLARLKKVSPTEHATAADAIKADPIIQQYERLNADPATDPADIPINKGMITRRTNQIQAVYVAWDALGKQKGGHEMYKMVRQYYQDAYTATRTLLNEQIDALPIDAAAKAKLLKSVRLMHEKSVGAAAETVLDEDGTPFAEVSFKNLPEDYFPFKRYGEYWLRVEGGPAGREFYLFENGKDRNLFQARRARELGVDRNDPKTFSKGDDIHALRQNFQDSSVMLQEMFAAIDGADTSKAPVNFSEDIKDQLYQIYLQTMPERSFRKQFIHADKVTGFSADILRNFKTSATAYSNQLAKLKYGTEINNSIRRARDTLAGMPADMRGRMELFVNEMDKRAQDEINPPEDSGLAAGVNQFAFIMLLTGAASAATQMASIPIMVMPTLSQQYGYGKASVELAKLMPIWKSVGFTQKDAETGEVTYTAPSLASSDLARKNPNLNRAFQEAMEKYNLFSLTNTSVITDTARTPDDAPETLLRKTGQTINRGMTALFTGSERMSREISFAMTFNLEFAKSGNFDEAVQKAVQTTHELLGRYDNMNRPRVLRNFAGRTIGQFKMYSIFMTSWFIRNANTMFREGLGEAEGRAATQRMAGVLLMGSLFHGLVGMPMYSVITSLIDALSDEEDEEVKKRLAKNPLTAMNSNFRFRYEFLPKYFGEITMPGLDGRQHSLAEVLEKGPISALTDINFSSRTSFDGMWWREAKPGKTFVETAQNIILSNLGPGVSTGFNMAGAIDDFSNGKIQRGLEKLVPAFFRGSLVSYRLGTEGAETKGGDKLLKQEEINTMNLIAAATGFQPTRLSRIQEKNFAIQKELVEAGTKRTKLLRRLNEIALDDKVDGAAITKAIKDIVEYNKRYPMEKFLIQPDTIRRSLETMAEKRGMTIRGQYMDKKLAPYVYPSTKAVTPLKEE